MEALPGIRLSDRAGEPLRGVDQARQEPAGLAGRQAVEPRSSRFEEHLQGARHRDSEPSDRASRAEDGQSRVREQQEEPAERSTGDGPARTDLDGGSSPADGARERLSGKVTGKKNSTSESFTTTSTTHGRAQNGSSPSAGTPGQPEPAIVLPATPDGAGTPGTKGGQTSGTQDDLLSTGSDAQALLGTLPREPQALPTGGAPSVAAGSEDGSGGGGSPSIQVGPPAEGSPATPKGPTADTLPGPATLDATLQGTDAGASRGGLELAGLTRDSRQEAFSLRELVDARAPQAARPAADPEAAAEILRQVRVGLSADLREANIQLAPEALGRVSIRVRVENGGLVADVRAETSQALRALELHAPELRAALTQGGIEPRSLAFGFFDQGAGRPGEQAPAPRRSGHLPREGADDHAGLAPISGLRAAVARRLAAGGVDTYA
jgi:hypothetical protein